jgi:ATP phosphoribosyltransferase
VERLTVALPKGRLLEPSVHLFQHLGYVCAIGNGSRQLVVDEPASNLRFLLARASDVPTYVEYGAADLGIVGQDVLWESGRDVYEPLLLGFGHCRLVLAGAPHHRGRDFRLVSSVRVATRYPRIARAYFLQQGISAEIIPLTGAVELAPQVGLADLVVDVVETGQTLRENGLVELAEIARCQATLIVNRVSLRLRLADVRRLLATIEMAIGSTGNGDPARV